MCFDWALGPTLGRVKLRITEKQEEKEEEEEEVKNLKRLTEK